MARTGPSRAKRAFNFDCVIAKPFQNNLSDQSEICNADLVHRFGLHVRAFEQQNRSAFFDLGHHFQDAGRRRNYNGDNGIISLIGDDFKTELIRRPFYVLKHTL